MSMLDDTTAGVIRDYLAKRMTEPVAIDLFTRSDGPGGSSYCDATGQLLAEIAALTEQVRLRVHEFSPDDPLAVELRVERAPTFTLRGRARGTVRYVGIPAGHEFSSLLEDLVDVSRGVTDLSDATVRALEEMPRPVHVQVFVTPGCPYCPPAARLAHKMAVESANVTGDVVEAGGFPDLVERYRVRGVPKIVVNEVVEFMGAKPEPEFLAEVLRGVS
jgi:glutaredoxin-like protein